MTIAHRFASGGYIARNGATVEVCVGPGAGGLPLVVAFEGEALAALAIATAAAFRERNGEWRDVADPPRPKRRRSDQRYTVRRTGRAEMDAKRWKEGSGHG